MAIDQKGGELTHANHCIGAQRRRNSWDHLGHHVNVNCRSAYPKRCTQ